MDNMNPAWIKRKKISVNLVLVAVFWNSSYCVADELVTREKPPLRYVGRFGLPRMCHVQRFFEF